MNPEPLPFQLFTEIAIIDQLAGSAFERALPAGITRAQFTVLHHFSRRGLAEQSPARLADAIQVTRGTMTSTLARMERSRLVTIRPDPTDGRAKLVALTEAGRTMRDACVAAVVPLFPLVDQTLDETELQAALHLLRRLRQTLDSARGTGI